MAALSGFSLQKLIRSFGYWHFLGFPFAVTEELTWFYFHVFDYSYGGLPRTMLRIFLFYQDSLFYLQNTKNENSFIAIGILLEFEAYCSEIKC